MYQNPRNSPTRRTLIPVSYTHLPEGYKVFAMEYLPGQYDQRADSAAQCVQLLTQGERPEVLTAKVVAVAGDITEEDLQKIQNYMVNPVAVSYTHLDVYKRQASLRM